VVGTVLRARRRGQAIVEFGLIALLFTGLMFAVVDFGLLLNTWLAVSSGSRELARSASVGKVEANIESQARKLALPSLTTQPFADLCCTSADAVEIVATYYDRVCGGGPLDCPLPASAIDNTFVGGTCASPCAHPVPGDMVKIELRAHGAQVITPLIRPFFGCTDGTNPNCTVTLSSSTVVRYEGQDF
jgi:hypothetical protein